MKLIKLVTAQFTILIDVSAIQTDSHRLNEKITISNYFPNAHLANLDFKLKRIMKNVFKFDVPKQVPGPKIFIELLPEGVGFDPKKIL